MNDKNYIILARVANWPYVMFLSESVVNEAIQSPESSAVT